MIPQINSRKDQKAEDNLKDSSDGTEDDTPDEEVVQFILSKVNSLAHVRTHIIILTSQLEEGEESANVETMIQKFHQRFPDMQHQKLLTCKMWMNVANLQFTTVHTGRT